MKKQNVKKTVLKEEELTKVVGGSTAHVGFTAIIPCSLAAAVRSGKPLLERITLPP